MLSRVIAITLLIALISCNLSRFFVYAGFSLNQKYIATTLCENKNRPWLHCNGRCYLMKKLHQAEEKEKSTERQAQKSLFQDAFFTAAATIKFDSHYLLQTFITPYQYSDQSVVSGAVFQPPRNA